MIYLILKLNRNYSTIIAPQNYYVTFDNDLIVAYNNKTYWEICDDINIEINFLLKKYLLPANGLRVTLTK